MCTYKCTHTYFPQVILFLVFEIAVTFTQSYNSSVHTEVATEPKCQNGTLWLYSVICFLICATGATIYTGESNRPVITAV